MRIVVCVKHVPDVESERGFVGTRVDRDHDMMLGEIDENAVEAALELTEEHGGDVIALALGPEDAEATVRRALQLGVDTGVLVSDDRVEGADALATAAVLASAVRKLGTEEPIDLVLAGMAALDGATSMVPAALADVLGWAQLTLARSIEVDGDRVVVERVLDDAIERVRGPLPAVISVTDEINEVRMPGFSSLMAAKKAPVTRWGLDDLDIEPDDVRLASPPSRVVRATQLAEREPGIVITDEGDGGTRLVAFLADRKLV